MPPLRDAAAVAKLPVNIVILGASSVGKTALTLQFITEKKVEAESCQPTIETSFFKNLKLFDQKPCEGECDSVFREDLKENGAECLWKMEEVSSERKRFAGNLPNLATKPKNKSSSTDSDTVPADFKTVLKVTDTASYKASYNPRKSLKERLAQKFTPKRSAPVSSSTDVPVRRRYRHHAQSSPKLMNGVPSFIYRKPNGKSNMHDNLIQTADAFILVYSVQSRRSFETLQKIREQIHSARGCSCAAEFMRASPLQKRASPECPKRRANSSSCGTITKERASSTGGVFPSIAVVGTHMDLAAPSVSPCMSRLDEENLSSDESLLKYPFSFSPDKHRSRKRVAKKPVSLSAEIMTQTSKPHPPEVTAEHVRGVITSWSECVGYAEISNDSVARVRRIFEHLTTQVVRKRTLGPKSSSLSSPRKRMGSILSVFSRKSDSDRSATCWPFRFPCCF